MRTGIRSIVFVACVATAFGPALAADDPAGEAKAALQPALGRLVATARDESLSPAAKRALVEHELAIWLDYAHMAEVALGPRSATFSSQQLAAFAREFERYLSDVYIRRVARFREKQVEIQRASADASSGVVTVRTLGGSPLGSYRDVHGRQQAKRRAEVDYLLRRQRGDWRIVAIRIDGVDLAHNFGEQFQAVLERSDPDGLIAELRKRNAEREAQNPWE